MNSVNSVFTSFESLLDIDKKEILSHGDLRLRINTNKFILEAILNYIKVAERFFSSLFEE